jgi:hypothetical protein
MNIKHFYLVGFICFGVITFFSSVNLYLDFPTLRQTNIIINFANIFFYAVLCYYFLGEFKKLRISENSFNLALEELANSQ